jgi:hypothetical protein
MSLRSVAAALALALAIGLIDGTSATTLARAQLTFDATLLRELRWRALGPAEGEMLSAAPDASFPYRVCGVERLAGAVCVSSLGIDSTIARTVGVAALRGRMVKPDPVDGDVLYGGNLVRYDRRLEQVVPVTPPIELAAEMGTAPPILFGPDGRTLFYGSRALWRTTTGGQSWTTASPDLTGGGAHETISAIVFSPLSQRLIWAGTSDGLVQVSRDGGMTWTRRESPSSGGPSSPVLSIEGSHFDINTLYVVVGSPSVSAPSAFRTRDAGETWKPLFEGVPAGRVNVIREDQLRRGLLFAGTDEGLFASYDDGESWTSLALDLPKTAVRDLFVRDADLVVATSGRGLWSLPDISVLRQMTNDVISAPTFLFRPATAWRLRAREGQHSTAGRVEPEGVALHYSVGAPLNETLTLEIIATTTGEVLRRFTSDAPAGSDDWLDRSPGLHRRIWDLRLSSPGSVPGDNHPLPGLRALPNAYQVRLTNGSRFLRQAVSIRMDPRVRATATDLAAAFTLSKSIDAKLRQLIKARADTGAGDPTKTAALDRALTELGAVYQSLQQFDGRPTPAVDAASAAAIGRADRALDGS